MSAVPDILKDIVVTKEQEIAALLARAPMAELQARADDALTPRHFAGALVENYAASGQVSLIAEVKKASPSKGIIRADFDPVWIAQRYEVGGAQCLSVLTDEQYFQGSLDYLHRIKEAVQIPILRKDFILDRAQLYESLIAGADAILLIAACLDPQKLFDLHAEAISLGLSVLVEVHDRDEWERITATGLRAKLVGVNNRNLHTFSVSLDTTAELAPAILESGAFLVAESGIFNTEHVATVARAGAGAILVGESLMREPDPAVAIRDMLGLRKPSEAV